VCSQAKPASNRKSAASSERDSFPVERSNSPVDAHSRLQSSISIDSGCPLTCNRSSSLMESSMQSSMVSDCLSMDDSSSHLPFDLSTSTRVESLRPAFHDSQLNLNQSHSIELANLYDQVAYDNQFDPTEQDEQMLMVDAYGGVHQFTPQPQTKSYVPSVARVSPPSYASAMKSRTDADCNDRTTSCATFRVQRRRSNGERVRMQQESEHNSPTGAHSSSSPSNDRSRRNAYTKHSNPIVALDRSSSVNDTPTSPLSNVVKQSPDTNQLQRIEAKQQQLRRVMQFVIRSCNSDAVNRPATRSFGGRSLFHGLQQSTRTRSALVNEAWVPSATDMWTACLPTVDSSTPINNGAANNAPEMRALIERQKQLQQQLQALTQDCCRLAPNVLPDRVSCTGSSLTALTDDCTGGNCAEDVRSNSQSVTHITKSPDRLPTSATDSRSVGSPNSDQSEHSLHLSNDSGIMTCNSFMSTGNNSATSSPLLESAAESPTNLTSRIELLRVELKSVVKVAIDQIRQNQQPSPIV
jgi:hypothetical protein